MAFDMWLHNVNVQIRLDTFLFCDNAARKQTMVVFIDLAYWEFLAEWYLDSVKLFIDISVGYSRTNGRMENQGH